MRWSRAAARSGITPRSSGGFLQPSGAQAKLGRGESYGTTQIWWSGKASILLKALDAKAVAWASYLSISPLDRPGRGYPSRRPCRRFAGKRLGRRDRFPDNFVDGDPLRQ